MKTWFNLLPLCFFPALTLLVIGAIPAIGYADVSLDGGALIRAWFMDHLVLPLLSNKDAWRFVGWYQSAGFARQYGLHALTVINLVVMSLPLVVFLGDTYLRVSNAWALREFNQKRKAAK